MLVWNDKPWSLFCVKVAEDVLAWWNRVLFQIPGAAVVEEVARPFDCCWARTHCEGTIGGVVMGGTIGADFNAAPEDVNVSF
jgi:hypothetical protein